MPAPYAAELEVMVHAVHDAGSLCRGVQAELVRGAAIEKADRSPVTIADLASQALVADRLAGAFPGVPLVAEEDSSVLSGDERGGVRAAVVQRLQVPWPGVDEAAALAAIDRGGAEGGSAGRFFTLDPIDGTRGFLRGAQYAVALALVEEGRLVAAVLGCPNLVVPDLDGAVGCLIVAARGAGARVLPFDGGASAGRPVRVSDVTDPARIRLCESVESAHTDRGGSSAIARALGIAADPVRLDSQCKYGVVACGVAELYLRLPTVRRRSGLIWDHAAGALAVAEAGGRVTDLDGRDLDFGRGRRLVGNRGIVASNGHVHAAVLEAAARLPVEDGAAG